MNNNQEMHLDQIAPWNLSQDATENILRSKYLQDAAADIKAVVQEFCVVEEPEEVLETEEDFPNWNLNESQIMNIIKIRQAQERLQGDTQ